HLYPVLVLIPYSWQSTRKLSVCIAFKANSIRCSIGSVFLQGIGRLFNAFLSLKCYLCIEPAALPMFWTCTGHVPRKSERKKAAGFMIRDSRSGLRRGYGGTGR